jgi:hypothetical protein
MRVDLLKLIQDFLLSFIRKSKVIEFIRSLVMPVQKATNDFELFSYEAMYRANANASAISLEHHIEREFDVKAKISEMDGKPVDFLVVIAGSVDEVRLRALIDQYKPAGKSYVFKIQEVVFSSQFIEHVCENMAVVFSSRFIEHVCETRQENTVTVSYGEDSERFYVYVNLQYPAASELEVMSYIQYEHSSVVGETQNFQVKTIVPAGETSAQSEVWTTNWLWNDGVYASSIDITYDEQYFYKVINQRN